MVIKRKRFILRQGDTLSWKTTLSVWERGRSPKKCCGSQDLRRLETLTRRFAPTSPKGRGNLVDFDIGLEKLFNPLNPLPYQVFARGKQPQVPHGNLD